MDAAARAAYASIDGGGLLHVFSTGHSHMIVEEMFYRSGGLVPVNPILSDELMLHTGAITSTHMEMCIRDRWRRSICPFTVSRALKRRI